MEMSVYCNWIGLLLEFGRKELDLNLGDVRREDGSVVVKWVFRSLCLRAMYLSVVLVLVVMICSLCLLFLQLLAKTVSKSSDSFYARYRDHC